MTLKNCLTGVLRRITSFRKRESAASPIPSSRKEELRQLLGFSEDELVTLLDPLFFDMICRGGTVKLSKDGSELFFGKSQSHGVPTKQGIIDGYLKGAVIRGDPKFADDHKFSQYDYTAADYRNLLAIPDGEKRREAAWALHIQGEARGRAIWEQIKSGDPRYTGLQVKPALSL